MYKKTTLIGILALAASLSLYVFDLIGRLMDRKIQIVSLEDLIGLDWIDDIPSEAIRQVLLSVSTAQIYVVLLIFGIGFIIISVFQKH